MLISIVQSYLTDGWNPNRNEYCEPERPQGNGSEGVLYISMIFRTGGMTEEVH